MTVQDPAPTPPTTITEAQLERIQELIHDTYENVAKACSGIDAAETDLTQLRRAVADLQYRVHKETLDKLPRHP